MNRLRELRTEKKLSLRELASSLNMSFSNIATLERGESQLREDTAKLFADFFNVSTDYLLGISNERNTASTQASLNGVKLALYNQLDELTEDQAKDALKYIEFLKAKKQ